MKLISALFALLLLARPAMAEMVMTLEWPAETPAGSLYLAQTLSYDSEVAGYFLIAPFPGMSIAMPMGSAAKMCITPVGRSRPISVLRGPFHEDIIPVVPIPGTNKICISLFAQESGTWNVEY